MASVCALSVAACSNGFDSSLEDDLAAPNRVDVLAPPKSPDPEAMHPALQLARARGAKTNVYFNEELQQAVARLQGMEETLGRLQSDLQGTAMAMQRVEMMRQEVESLNLKIQSLQERVMYAGPTLAPEAPPMAQPLAMQSPAENVPQDATAAPRDVQISKPVMEAPKPVKAATAPTLTGDGVAGVRVGVHPDSVRIVFDVNGAETKFTTNLDNAEKLLTVEMPQTTWSAAKAEAFKGNAVIDSYMAQAQGQGTVVAFTLKGTSKVLGSKLLKGAAGQPSRIVIDLAR